MSRPEEAAGVGRPLVGCQFWAFPGPSDLVLFRPNFQWGPGAAKRGLSATDPCLLMVDAGRESCLEEAHCDTPTSIASANPAHDAAAATLVRPLGPARRPGDGDSIDVQAQRERGGLLLHGDTEPRREDCILLCRMPALPDGPFRQSDADFACRCNQAAPSTSISR